MSRHKLMESTGKMNWNINGWRNGRSCQQDISPATTELSFNERRRQRLFNHESNEIYVQLPNIGRFVSASLRCLFTCSTVLNIIILIKHFSPADCQELAACRVETFIISFHSAPTLFKLHNKQHKKWTFSWVLCGKLMWVCKFRLSLHSSGTFKESLFERTFVDACSEWTVGNPMASIKFNFNGLSYIPHVTKAGSSTCKQKSLISSVSPSVLIRMRATSADKETPNPSIDSKWRIKKVFSPQARKSPQKGWT